MHHLLQRYPKIIFVVAFAAIMLVIGKIAAPEIVQNFGILGGVIAIGLIIGVAALMDSKPH